MKLVLVHLINFVQTRIDLVERDVSLVLLVDHSEDRLVLLFVNREFLLHFEGRRGEQARRIRLLLLVGVALVQRRRVGAAWVRATELRRSCTCRRF